MLLNSHSEERQNKGKQNHICVDCGHQFIDCYQTAKGYTDEVKRNCLKMYVNGMGLKLHHGAPTGYRTRYGGTSHESDYLGEASG